MITDAHPWRIAFLGVGHPHAHMWARAVDERSDATIAAVHDPDAALARDFAARYHAPTVALEEAVGQAIDAVVVDGRNSQAASFATSSLEAGLPTFIEKTGGMSAAELHAVANVASRANLPTQLGYFLRYSEAVRRAKEVLEQGTLGRISLARFHCAIPHKAWVDSPDWFADPSNVVGPFNEAGCHMIDIVRMLFGDPTSVSGSMSHWDGTSNPFEASLGAVLSYPSTTVTVTFTAHEANPWNHNWSFEISGTDGTLRGGLTPSWAELNTGTLNWDPLTPPLPTAETDLAASLTRENATFMRDGFEYFLNSARHGGPAVVDARSGALTLQLIEAVYADARERITPQSRN